MTHRFASHCCEALFIQSASVVSAEMLVSPKKMETNSSEESMEILFVNALAELENSLGYLMTDKFASHTLRVLLLVLSGDPIPRSTKKSPLQSRKKENIGQNGTRKGSDIILDKRAVPDSFQEALERFLSKCNSGLNTGTLRLFATHQVGNPMLQLLLQLELSHFGKSRARDEDSLIHKLLPDDPITSETESATFINGLAYDTVGSRLLETIIEYAPGRLFKQLFREYFKERLPNLSKNDVASYVVIKIIMRVGKDDLEEVASILAPEIPTLVERNRIALIRTLIDRCQFREIDPSPIANALQNAYEVPNGFDISRLLKLSDAVTGSQEAAHSSSNEKLHGSLLAQTMLTIPGKMSNLIFDSLARLGTPLSLSAAKEPSASHTISAALTAPTASIIFRRKMIQQFYGHVGEMALDPSASRVIDAVWAGTQGLAFIRERVAEELAENEASLRGSKSGRAVWHNWRMDRYKKNRREWVVESRESAGLERFVDFPGRAEGEKENTFGSPRMGVDERSGRKYRHGKGKEKREGEGERRGRHWTALEKARHKHAKEKQKREREARRAENGKGKKRKHAETEELSTSLPAVTAGMAS